MSLDTNINPNTCAICLETVAPEADAPSKEESPKTLNCSHLFHQNCIDNWLQEKDSCPLCRKEVKVEKPETPLYETSPEETLSVRDHQQPARNEAITSLASSTFSHNSTSETTEMTPEEIISMFDQRYREAEETLSVHRQPARSFASSLFTPWRGGILFENMTSD